MKFVYVTVLVLIAVALIGANRHVYMASRLGLGGSNSSPVVSVPVIEFPPSEGCTLPFELPCTL